MCTPEYIMLTLLESVPTSTGKFQWFIWVFLCVHVDGTCEWNLHQLTECIAHVSCLIDYKRVSHSPFFSVALMAWITLPPEWGNSWGSLVLTSSSLPTFFKCLGKLEGRMLRLGLKHSLDGLLHQTRAIGGACCFLHQALFPHTILSYTVLESSYSWGCLQTCPYKKNTLLRIFVGQG